MTTTSAPEAAPLAFDRLRTSLYALGLVASPLLILGYWCLYPAYGDVHGADVFADISAAPGRTHLADGVMLVGCLLAVAGALAYLQALVAAAPRLARVGATCTVVGWVAVLALLVLDVVAAQGTTTARSFEAVYSDPLVITLNALAALHLLGGVLIGVALLRTRLVPRGLAAAGAVAPVVHFVSNVSGLLWVDAATWLVTAALGAAVLRLLLHHEAAQKPLPVPGMRVQPAS